MDNVILVAISKRLENLSHVMTSGRDVYVAEMDRRADVNIKTTSEKEREEKWMRKDRHVNDRE